MKSFSGVTFVSALIFSTLNLLSSPAFSAGVEDSLQERSAAKTRFYQELEKIPKPSPTDYQRLQKTVFAPIQENLQSALIKSEKERSSTPPLSKKALADEQDKEIKRLSFFATKKEDQETLRKSFLDLNKAGIQKAQIGMQELKGKLGKTDEEKVNKLRASLPNDLGSKTSQTLSPSIGTNSIQSPGNETVTQPEVGLDGTAVPREIEFPKK